MFSRYYLALKKISMKKTLLLALFSLLLFNLGMAQTGDYSGTLSDTKGNTLHHVFVGDIQYKIGTFSDSLGNFSIPVHADSKLQISASGYRDTLVNATPGASGIQLTLSAVNAASASSTSLSAKVNVEGSNSGRVASFTEGGAIAPGHRKQDTRGSQYLFEVFVPGYLIDVKGDVIYSSAYQFDYDKITGNLLLSRDGKTIENVNWDQVQAFTLFSPTDQRFDFDKVPEIDKSHYLQSLGSGKKYKILKQITTKFVKSDYANSGMIQHGNDYDEYVDDANYFVYDVEAKQVLKLSLKKKSIKEDFAKEADKVNKFLSSNSGSIDDEYLTKLGTFLNQ